MSEEACHDFGAFIGAPEVVALEDWWFRLVEVGDDWDTTAEEEVPLLRGVG